jgi:hypothetical protein
MIARKANEGLRTAAEMVTPLGVDEPSPFEAEGSCGPDEEELETNDPETSRGRVGRA